jgi:hypothetical protein
MTASRDASVVTLLGESVMNDMTDTTEGSEVSRVNRDGCDSHPARVTKGSAPKCVACSRLSLEVIDRHFK